LGRELLPAAVLVGLDALAALLREPAQQVLGVGVAHLLARVALHVLDEGGPDVPERRRPLPVPGAHRLLELRADLFVDRHRPSSRGPYHPRRGAGLADGGGGRPMGIARTLLGKAGRGLWLRVMNRAGRLVGRVVDTSADAPDYNYKPKRDLYEKMQQEGARDGDRGHDHDH